MCCCCLVSKLCPNFAMPWTIAHQCSLSMGFLRQEYWGELPFPVPGDLPDPGIKLVSPVLAGRFFTTVPSGCPMIVLQLSKIKLCHILGFQGGASGKKPACQCVGDMRRGFDHWVGKMPWRSERLPTPVFWLREFHGLYSPWGCKE